MITTSDSTKAIATALLKFQGEVTGVKRDGANPHFKSRYATLENVMDTARPALQECGISFVQAPGAIVEGSLEVTTRLTHAESGEWMQSTMHMPLGKRDPQGAGSATTYGLRYSLMAMLGLPPTDDDGEAAMERMPQSVGAAATPKLRDNLKIYKPSGRTSSKSLKEDKSPDNWDAFEVELGEVQTVAGLTKFALAWSHISERDIWPTKWHTRAKELINERKEELINAPVPDDDTFPGDPGYVSTIQAG